MRLYYSPGTCSLASHIALIEGDAEFEKTKVDLGEKKTEDGQNYLSISPRGYVPAIDTEFGLLTENPAVLTYIAEQTGTLPEGENFYRMIEWIGFIGTEIHVGYAPLFHDGSDEEQAQAREEVAESYELAAKLLGGKQWLVGDAPTVADNYLFVTTLWADQMNIEIPSALQAFRTRNLGRASVKKAMEAEGLG